MDIITGGKKVAGASIGDSVIIIFIDGSIERIILDSVDRYGVQGFSKRFKEPQLELYPWTNIKKVRKDNE